MRHTEFLLHARQRLLRDSAFVYLMLLLLPVFVDAQQSAPSEGPNPSSKFSLKSKAFAPGGPIPKVHTCEGKNLSPALEWSNAPAKMASFVLIVDDPDAPSGTWTHWVLWNLPPNIHRLGEGIPQREQLDNGARQGQNSDHNVGYDGPCPPAGRAHRYFFRLYALDRKLDIAAGSSRATLLEAIKGHIVAEAEYMGRYAKGGGT